ncbi:hypothetical protein [Nonomuraea sp. NPDC046570]|uniref:hypothetical protein n=1 Tax=Nonomuraea sp. NPDC046570 TaxID=3155255 RepID=UPI003402B0CF
MSVTARTCLIITCTRCGEVNDECQAIHADTIDDVRAWFSDWQWSNPDTPELCPGCVADLDCERDGHQWKPWQSATIPGREHIRFRSCAHCSDLEHAA